MSSRTAETGRSRAVPFLVLALLLLAALTSPVRAAEGPSPAPIGLDLDISEEDAFAAMDQLFLTAEPWDLDPDLEFEVLDRLLLEIALIDHLDGFIARDLFVVDDIHDAYAPWLDVAPATTAAFLFEVDDDLADLGDEVGAELGAVPAMAEALDEIAPALRDGLSRGDRGIVPVAPYIRALDEILSFGNADALLALGAPNAAVIAELPFVLPAFAQPFALDGLRIGADRLVTDAPAPTVAPTVDTFAEGGPDPIAEVRPAAVSTGVDDPSDTGSPWFVIGAIAGSGMLVGILVAWALLRRGRRRDDSRVTEQVFEAHRRLSTARGEAEIADIVGIDAAKITGASDATIFRHTSEGLRRIGDSVVVVSSALHRVVETAQPLIAVLDDDPAVGSAAVCAVPLVTDGRVTAVLVVRRPDARPFGNEARRRLELLAPALGGALASADTLGSFEHMALVDGLTSLGNRRRLDGDLETTLNEAAASDLTVAFAMIDVDHFKHFNDTHGHEAGDRALQTVARVIADTVRATDIVYRYGGEEFSVLLPGAAVEEAAAVGERIRAAVEAARIDGEESQPGGRLTVSVGISTLESGNAQGLKTRADEALYDAKARGRNCAVVA
ncbi:MAG: sensor domain-containing diguanylate cyclase [Acidimicrobiales bacterium]